MVQLDQSATVHRLGDDDLEETVDLSGTTEFDEAMVPPRTSTRSGIPSIITLVEGADRIDRPLSVTPPRRRHRRQGRPSPRRPRSTLAFASVTNGAFSLFRREAGDEGEQAYQLALTNLPPLIFQRPMNSVSRASNSPLRMAARI